MAFSEVRQYQPGDDVRAHRLERDRDARGEAAHQASSSKSADDDHAAAIEACRARSTSARASRPSARWRRSWRRLLAFSAIKNNDHIESHRVSPISIELFVHAQKGRKHVLALITRDLTFEARVAARRLKGGAGYRTRRASSLGGISHQRLHRRRRHGRAYEQPMVIAKRNHDLVPVTLTDPMSEEIPNLGVIMLRERSGDRRGRDLRLRRPRSGSATRRWCGAGARSARRCFAVQHGLRQRAHRPAVHCRRWWRSFARRRAGLHGGELRRSCCFAATCSRFAQADDGSVDADAPSVGASLDKTEVHVGDHVALTISAVARDGAAVTLPVQARPRQAGGARPR